mgnify:CR=1 FL=1
MTAFLARRGFLASGLAAAGIFASARRPILAQAPAGPFSLPPLPYATSANEAAIDAMTMEIHHGRHHAAFIANLNNMAREYPALATTPIDDVLMRLTEAFQTLPNFLLLLVLVSIFGSELITVVVAIGVVSWPATARLTRAEFLTQNRIGDDYIAGMAARDVERLGCGGHHHQTVGHIRRGQRHDGVFMARHHQIVVDFIGYQNEVMALAEFSDAAQFLGCPNLPTGVMRRT